MDSIIGLSDRLYLALNALAGRSLLFDSFLALAAENSLVKGGLIGACFAFAWYRADANPEATIRRRQILLVTIAACFLVIAVTKTLSNLVFLPRPFVLSQNAYLMEGERLEATPRLAFRVPLGEPDQAQFAKLRQGAIQENDLGSFPSDHAGLFVALAVGILLASRCAGLVALGWALVVILGSRMISGRHSPLDIAAGAAIGTAILLACQAIAARWGRPLMEPVARWTMAHPAMSSAVLFLFLFEAASTMGEFRDLARLAKSMVLG
jgi:undecaprenyl-diphosphatase